MGCDILCSTRTTLEAVMRRDGNRGKSGNTISRELLVGFQVRGNGGLDQTEVVKMIGFTVYSERRQETS